MMGRPQRRTAWHVPLVVLSLLALDRAAAAERPLPPAPQWQNLGEVDVVPCPKRIELSGESMRLTDVRLLCAPDDDERAAMGAEEIAARIVELGGRPASLAVVTDPITVFEAVTGPSIIIGHGRDRLPAPDVEHIHGGISAWDEEQGYVIASRKLNGHGVVIVWGREPLGALYGCITLRHLLHGEGDAVALRLATVVDWPDFKQRITSGFFGARDDTEAEIAKAAEVARRFIRRAALLKCNAITPARHWSVRTQPDYLRECDVRLLERLTPYAKSYGVRFYIQHFTSVGTAARDKRDPRYADVPDIRGWYMSWSHEELIDLSMGRFRNEARRIGGNADWFFHYPDVHEGGWPQRSVRCRERWGNDHAAADAYFGNKLYGAMKSASPTSRISLACYPYGLDLDLPGNVLTLRYFERISSLLPDDVLLTRREGTRAAFRSWWRHIRQPIRLAWSPRTFWGARALSPDMAFVKSGWRGHPGDGVEDCLTVYSRPVLDVSGYTFAEYAWNVSAPGSGTWRADPKEAGKVVGLSAPGDQYVFERVLAPDGTSGWNTWIYLRGRQEPREFSYDLVERCCRLIYGTDVAAAMAEALRYAPLVQESKWSSEPDVAAALAESAERSFRALVPLWGRKELFARAPGSQVDTYGVYAQIMKVNADLTAILGVRAAKIAADTVLERARNAVDPAEERAAAQEAAEAAARGLDRIETARRELRDAYREYELEGKSWYMLLAAGYRTREEVESKLDTYAGGFRLVQEEAEALRSAPAAGERRRSVLLPKTTRRVTIDGDGAEWTLLNPLVIGTGSCSAHVDPRPSGNADGSAICYLAWDREHLYVLAKVIDDDGPRAGEGTTGTGDSLCLWLNGNHFAVGSSPEGTARLETYSGIPPANALAVLRPVTAHDLSRDIALLWEAPEGMDGKPGYVVELQLPWEPMRVDAALGEVVWLALGVRDLDEGQQATACVFPPTYRRLDSGGVLTDFAAATLTGETSIRCELTDLRKEDRTMQVGTDTIIHAVLLLDSPVDLSGLRVRYAVPGGDGRPIATGLVPGVGGILRGGKPWRSDPFELNAGPSRKRVPLVLTVTADEVGVTFEETAE